MNDPITCVDDGATFRVRTGIVERRLCFQLFRIEVLLAGRPISFSEFWAMAAVAGSGHEVRLAKSETECLIEFARGEAVVLQIRAPTLSSGD